MIIIWRPTIRQIQKLDLDEVCALHDKWLLKTTNDTYINAIEKRIDELDPLPPYMKKKLTPEEVERAVNNIFASYLRYKDAKELCRRYEGMYELGHPSNIPDDEYLAAKKLTLHEDTFIKNDSADKAYAAYERMVKRRHIYKIVLIAAALLFGLALIAAGAFFPHLFGVNTGFT